MDYIETRNLVLKRLSHDDNPFIEKILKDEDFKRFYIIPKDVNQEYLELVKYWHSLMDHNEGFTWIINSWPLQKSDVPERCGFVTYRHTLSSKTVTIDLAVERSHRNSNIASETIMCMISHLEDVGVEIIEADIYVENETAVHLAEKFGFIANKKRPIYDPEIKWNGKVRRRLIWVKDLGLKEINAPVYLKSRIIERNDLINELKRIESLIYTKGKHPILVSKYYHLKGRLLIMENGYSHSLHYFNQSNLINRIHGLKENHENYYWFAFIAHFQNGSKDYILEQATKALEFYSRQPELITKSVIHELISMYR